MANSQPTSTPCPHCGQPVYILATTCIHCRGPLKFTPAVTRGSIEAFRMMTGWKQPDLPEADPEPMTDSRLVTAAEVASFLDINRTSIKTKTWPAPYIRPRGNRPGQWRWENLRPFLEQQYPKDNWSEF